jgi:hypothetical protein
MMYARPSDFWQAKYGFIAFSDPEDFLKAWKEMDGGLRWR